MEKLFLSIQQTYRQLYRELFQEGKFPFRETQDGYWGASVTDEVFELFQKINLGHYQTFLDLGSGDGKVVLLASLFGVKATGIETDPELFQTSLKIKTKLSHVPKINKTTFLNQNYFNHDFSQYDVLYIFSDRPFYRGLEDKLGKELKGILIVYGSHFLPLRLKKINSFVINGTVINVYQK